jgi:hypothetical protein
MNESVGACRIIWVPRLFQCLPNLNKCAKSREFISLLRPLVVGFSLQRKALPASMLANKAEDFEVCLHVSALQKYFLD